MARKMKDSGIEWIGEIPTDFSLYKLKYLLSSPLCYGANESGTLYSDILPRYIRITDISPNGTLKNSGMLSLDESSAQNYMLHEGDILFARSGATVGKSFIYHNYYGRAAYAGYLIKASFNRLVLPEFVYYYTCSSAYEIWKNSIFIQSTIQNIGADRYSNLPISVPNSIDKQLRIVRYLNNFCSKFDAIIYNLQTSIEDYKKLKQAIITQAVTKGVRGEREMKDSGVEWAGLVPHHWGVAKIGSIGQTSSGATPLRSKESSFFDDATIRWVRTLDLNDGFVYDSSEKITELALASSACSIMPKGTVCVAMYDGAGTIGKCGLLMSDCATNQAVCSIVCNRKIVSPIFLLMQLLALKSYWMKYAVGTRKDPNISQDIVARMKILIPPLDEQKEITDHLDAKCAEIDGLIAKKEQLVKELESYKKSLIYEVVTGKREV